MQGSERRICFFDKAGPRAKNRPGRCCEADRLKERAVWAGSLRERGGLPCSKEAAAQAPVTRHVPRISRKLHLRGP